MREPQEEPQAACSYASVYPAEVVSLADPESVGRVRVRLPWLEGAQVWARLAVPLAGAQRGTWWRPDVGDEVLVAFAFGDLDRAHVLGSLWSAEHPPPETLDSQQDNAIKSITSRSGIKITLDDSSGAEQLTLETPAGQRVLLDDGASQIEVHDTHGNSIRLDAGGVTVTSSSSVKVAASQVEVSAGAVNVNAGLSRFSGVLQADTLIANSVVASSYTPGAGNIW